MYCRGHNTRVHIVNNFNIRPLGRFKLLNGQTVISDAGNMDIIDEYIVFDCIDKHNPNHHESIYCGRFVAEDLCTLSGCSMPPLFNPLKTINRSNSSGQSSSQNKNTWNKTRKQLYNCTLLLIMYFENSPKNKALFSIKQELEDPNFISYYPKKQVKSINTYLFKSEVTFQYILDQLGETNDLRDFSYTHILEYLEKLKIQQHFC